MENPQNITELYILDHNLELLSTIKDFNKLEWTEKIYEADSFSLELDFKKIKNTRLADYNYYKTLYEAIVNSTRKGYYPRFIITNAEKA